MNRRRTAVLSVLASGVLVSSLGLAGATSATPAPSAADTTTKATSKASGDIALKGYAYGTLAKGGQVPANSGMTAFSVIGCTTRVGIERGNVVAEAAIPGVGTISGVKTELWTRKVGNALHSYSRATTASVVVAETPLGSLSIRGVSSLSHAWHDASGFHAETESSIGKIVFTPPVGGPQELDIPTPGQPIEIPDLGTIHLGITSERATKTAATARAAALRIDLRPSTGTEVTVARSTARAVLGVKYGRFNGFSAGTEISALDGVITSGRNPLSLMPCQGTNGQVLSRSDAHLDLGGQVIVDGVSSAQMGKRLPTKSVAWERGAVAGVNLGGGQLVIDAVVGKAHVTRTRAGKLTTSTEGTTIGSITVNGQAQELPLDETIEIPGLAKIEPKVVTKVPGGIKVVALRITLLDGQGAVINLGVAKVAIRTR